MTVEPLRADARRNRDAIVAAATAQFTESGPNVSLDVVAREAGVGVATLYRRFPDRDSLVRAVVTACLDQVLADTRAAREGEARAWDALVRAVRYSPALKTLFRLAASSAPVIDRALEQDEDLARTRAEVVGLLDELVRAAQADGALRADVGVGDVVHLMSALAHAHSQDDPAADRAFVRAQAIVLDGLQHHDTPLPAD